MNAPEIISLLREKQPEIIERFKARIVGIFGSYARNEQRPESDLDVLYEPVPNAPFGLTELNDLDEYLQQLVQITKVDLVSRKYVNPVIELEIQDDIQYV